MQALVFAVKGELYALETVRVRELLAAPVVTAVPTAPSTVVGVANLRGEIVPVFDTASLLGLGTTMGRDFALVVETGLGPAGLLTTVLPEPVELGTAIGDPDAPWAMGEYAWARHPVTLVDPDSLLAPARIGSWTA